MKEMVLKIIDEDLQNLYYEMKHLDRQYIEKQKRVRELKKVKAEIEQIPTDSSK
jgi:hypothetical protein